MNSGKMVASILDNNLYDVYLIKIKGKEWNYEKENQTFAIDKNDFSLLINENRIHFDCVFLCHTRFARRKRQDACLF